MNDRHRENAKLISNALHSLGGHFGTIARMIEIEAPRDDILALAKTGEAAARMTVLALLSDAGGRVPPEYQSEFESILKDIPTLSARTTAAVKVAKAKMKR